MPTTASGTLLCLGYCGNMIKEYFLNYEAMNNDFTICLGRQNCITYHEAHKEQDFKVTLAETGPDTMTGGRVKPVEKYITEDTFMVTYGDGVADIDMGALLDFHKAHGKLATVTTVRPISRYGILDVDNQGKVLEFTEKPQIDGWASAGFLVLHRSIFEAVSGDDCFLERGATRAVSGPGTIDGVPPRRFLFCDGYLPGV